jgi:UDP-glucose 4-epimerase
LITLLSIAESREAALLPRVPLILKEFFEEDILEEEVLLDWAKKVSIVQLHHFCGSFSVESGSVA